MKKMRRSYEEKEANKDSQSESGHGGTWGKTHGGDAAGDDTRSERKQGCLEIVTINNSMPVDSVVLVSQEDLFPSQDSEAGDMKATPGIVEATQPRGGVKWISKVICLRKASYL